METSFFSGSENLYKYLVTIGLLLIVMTVYYPLKEKQELEIITIQLEKDLETLNFKIRENSKNVENLKKTVKKNGNSIETDKMLTELEKLNQENNFSQISSEKKYSEIISRKRYIALYNWMFYIFFPTGTFLFVFGFLKWKSAKKYEDNILKLENEKLELEVKKLRQDFK